MQNAIYQVELSLPYTPKLPISNAICQVQHSLPYTPNRPISNAISLEILS